MIEWGPLIARLLAGQMLSCEEAVELAGQAEASELYDAADQVRHAVHGKRFDVCSIINARSGKCTEDCRFCAQSARYQVKIDTYDSIPEAEVLRQACENERAGVSRYSLVTAGKEVCESGIEHFCSYIKLVRDQTNLSCCASMGFLTPAKARRLVDSGVTRYHCNLETCKSFFPEVCTTHTWEQKVETIAIAREAGMEVCSGGIIGMGETQRQRIELACELRDLQIKSIPINILTPIPGTPLAELKPLSVTEILSTIALFRLLNPLAVVRLAGGRAQLGEQQHRCFTAGANGAIVGNYLTTAGNDIKQDFAMIRKLGFIVEQIG